MSETNRNLNSEYSSSDSEPAEPSSVAAQLQKIQTHLGFLEKKLDLLLAQQSQGGRPSGGFSRPRPSGGGRDFPPRRPFRGGGNDFRSRDSRSDRPPMREGRPPMREGRGGGEDRPREFRGGHGGGHSGGFKKRPRQF